HDRPDRLLARDQRVQDVATVRLGNCIEDIRRRGRAGHGCNICRYRNMSTCGPERKMDARPPPLRLAQLSVSVAVPVSSADGSTSTVQVPLASSGDGPRFAAALHEKTDENVEPFGRWSVSE